MTKCTAVFVLREPMVIPCQRKDKHKKHKAWLYDLLSKAKVTWTTETEVKEK